MGVFRSAVLEKIVKRGREFRAVGEWNFRKGRRN